jgi:hypothetical protein
MEPFLNKNTGTYQGNTILAPDKNCNSHNMKKRIREIIP